MVPLIFTDDLLTAPFLLEDAPLNRGRVCWWVIVPGLDGGRFLYNLCGRRHGTLMSMTSNNGWRRPSRVGSWGSMQLGTSSVDSGYIDCGNISELSGVSSFSLGFWFRRASSGSKVSIGQNTNSGNSAITGVEIFSDGVVYCELTTGAGFAYGQFSSNDANWHRLLLVYRGSGATNADKWKAYFDGFEKSMTYSGTIQAANGASTGSFCIGNLIYFSSNHFSRGWVDDVSIWNRPLSANEAMQDYRESCSYHTGSLRRLWKGMSLLHPASSGGTKPVLFHAHYMNQGMR